MRLRISYTGSSGPVLEQTEVNNFPTQLFNSQWQERTLNNKRIVYTPA